MALTNEKIHSFLFATALIISIKLQSQSERPASEFNEFEPRLKSAKNRFQLSAGLNLEKLNTILSETNHV